jgi:hypothetical protein
MGRSNRVEVIGENGLKLMHSVTFSRARRMVAAGLARWTDDGRIQCVLDLASDISAPRSEGAALLTARISRGGDPGCRLGEIIAFVSQRSPYRFRSAQ